MSEPCIGEIRIFAGTFAPKRWAFCNGQILPIAQNQALFAILGTTYGGNGVTTFALPDLRGRLPMNWGSGPGLSAYTLGQATGAENVTLTLNNLAPHTHNMQPACNNSAGSIDSQSPVGAFPAAQDVNSGGPTLYAKTNPGNATMIGAPSGATGGNQPHTNIQPVLAVNFIICLQGIFPSRN